MREFKLTKKLLRKIYKEYNNDFLHLKITPRFKIKHLKPHNRGMITCYEALEDEPARVTITVSSRPGENPTIGNIACTVVHEMIHQYQFENSLPVEHDKEFTRWTASIRAYYGIDIK